MLSYKEYKLLNESLYGAFNLGLKSPNVIAGVVSSSNINGTEAAIEAESEEAIEEAKKMKKKMDCGSEEEDMEKKVSDEEEVDDEEGDEGEESEESDDEEGEEDSEGEEEPKFMKKKAKKEWSEIVADLESFLEDVSEEESLLEIKKGLELIKEGMKKGKHKEDCGCPFCKKSEAKKDDKEEGEEGDKEEGESKGLSAAQKKLPKALQDAILKKKGKGKSEEKKCGKYMKEEEQAWWDSVNSMLNANPDQKNWDGGWSEVGEVQQAIRENSELKKK